MMVMDYFGFLSWIYGKMDQKRKIWAIAGVLRSGEETPRSGEGTPHRGEAEREVGQASSSSRLSHCSQHRNVVFLFRFVFSLLRRLVYWTNEDSISV